MSSLVAVRCSRRLTDSLAGSSTRPRFSVTGQSRGYAAGSTTGWMQPNTKQVQSYRPPTSGKGKKKKVNNRGPTPFLALLVNQLTKPVFKSNQRAVLELPTFSPEVMTEAAVGKVMTFPLDRNEAIRAYGVPQSLLMDYRLLSKPCSVVRDITLTALNTLDAAQDKSSLDTRLVMTGPSGCGKSYVLLQTVEYATRRDWIVLYISRGVSLVNSSSHYMYDARTRTYFQPEASFQILRRFLSVNEKLIQNLKTQERLELADDAPVRVGTRLTDLINVALEKPEHAPIVLNGLMNELSHQSTVPVLLAVDDIQALYGYTLYRDQHYAQLRAHHLSIPRMILEYASGKRSFPRGAIMGAEGTAHTTFEMPLELRESLGLPEFRPAGPYVKRYPEMIEYSRGLRNFPVPAELSIPEAASLFEVWMGDNALHSGEVFHNNELRSQPGDTLFMSKYTEAGGNARAFVWNGLMSTLGSF